MAQAKKVTKRATAVAVTKTLSRQTSRQLHLTEGQRRAILQEKSKRGSAQQAR